MAGTRSDEAKEAGRELVRHIVARYAADRSLFEDPGGAYPEAQARIDFIDPLLAALGWDLANALARPHSVREVVLEPSIELVGPRTGATGRPNYTLRPDGERRLFVEAKKPSVDIVL